jgi:hypothetical protein
MRRPPQSAWKKLTGRFRPVGEFVPETIDRVSKMVKQEIVYTYLFAGFAHGHQRHMNEFVI